MKVLCLKNRWDKKLLFNMVNTNIMEIDNLLDTLKMANNYTIENDMPGYFFEAKDADPAYIKENDIIAFVNNYNEIVCPNEYEVLNVIGNEQPKADQKLTRKEFLELYDAAMTMNHYCDGTEQMERFNHIYGYDVTVHWNGFYCNCSDGATAWNWIISNIEGVDNELDGEE